MNIVKVVLNVGQYLNPEDTETFREFHGNVLRNDGQPLTEEDASFLKTRYNPLDTYVGPA